MVPAAGVSSRVRLNSTASKRLALLYPVEPLSTPESFGIVWEEPFRGFCIVDRVSKSINSEVSSSVEDPTGPISRCPCSRRVTS